MKSLLLCLFASLVFTSAAVISPLTSFNASETIDTVANRPVAGTPDPRFTIEAYFDGPKLPMISCLMSTVESLVMLGLQDFSGSMNAVIWKLDDYPEVGVVISPRTLRGRIETRFVIWGLSHGAAYMIHLKRFQTVTFTLFWAGEGFGSIKLVDWPAKQYTSGGGIYLNSTQNRIQPSDLSIAKNPSGLSLFPEITNITAENERDRHLIVRAALTGSVVPLFEVFLLVIAVLVDAAELGATERLQDYASPANAASVKITFKKPVPARRSPPYFEAQWLMKTMATIPRYMIMKGVFKEELLLVEIDGVRVADGFLERQEAGVGLTNVSSIVAVS